MEEKKTVLLELLKMRYECAHKMRERSQAFALWILGGGIALFGLLLKMGELPTFKKFIITVFVFALSVTAKRFLSAIEVGFEANKKIQIKIEEVLGFYKKGEFLEGDALYPQDYACGGKVETSHFQSLYRWLWVVATFLVVFIWGDNLLALVKQAICCR